MVGHIVYFQPFKQLFVAFENIFQDRYGKGFAEPAGA